jgi:RNA methyltransferase, TrmH family
VRRLRRLVQKRTLRWSEGACVLEGPDLIEAALASGQEFEALYVDGAAREAERTSGLIEAAARSGVRCFTLAAGVVERVTDSQSPQSLVASVRFTPPALGELPLTGLALILHDVRDPGNAGTVIRSADAAGANAVILTGHSVDPYNPKTLRATAGSIFHLPVVVAELTASVAHLRAGGARTWAAVVRGGTPLAQVGLGGPAAVVLGNESSGLDDEALAVCDATLSIPMSGRSESLNVGVAASLVAFEAMRQREAHGHVIVPPSLGGS